MELELITGMPCQGGVRQPIKGPEDAIVNEPYIFAINDQELEYHQLENTLILAA